MIALKLIKEYFLVAKIPALTKADNHKDRINKNLI